MSNLYQLQGRTAIVTGGSSGIGLACVEQLLEAGAAVAFCGRNQDRLNSAEAHLRERFPQARLLAQVCDVLDGESVKAFAAASLGALGPAQVLINNAGVMPLSRLDALKVDEWNRMVDVNIRGVLHGIAAALPVMQRQRSGQFVNIASIGAYSVVPTGAVYCATKYAVRAISEGLRQEVGGDIRVTLVSPGVVESELAESISDESSREAMKAFRKVAITPDAIARAIAYAVEQPVDVDVSELIVRPTASPY